MKALFPKQNELLLTQNDLKRILHYDKLPCP